jgi:hypothetical protein
MSMLPQKSSKGYKTTHFAWGPQCGTPGLIVGNQLVLGSIDYRQLEQMIAEARRSRADLDVNPGTVKSERVLELNDAGPMIAGGVPSLAPAQDTRFYFNYHHTAADTLDKVDKQHLAENAAVIVVTAYALADASTPAPREMTSAR